MWLVAGLGNPGKEYEHTRHNVGFMVVDRLVDHFSPSFVSKASFKGELFKSDSFLFLKPLTYMNLSGESLLPVKQFYQCEHFIVIHDDLDLPFGALRFKRGGGHGGHNGLKSIDSLLGKDYIRIRLGIGKPERKSETASYVLQAFSNDEVPELPFWLDKATEATIHLLKGETLESVASRFSQKEIVKG